jgi:hypothetical protein
MTQTWTQKLSKAADVDYSDTSVFERSGRDLSKEQGIEAKHRNMSFLAIEGLHAFVTGASGGIGQAIVEELLGTTLQALPLHSQAYPNS